MLWYVVKYKNNNKEPPTEQDKKPKGKWIPFVKELLLNGKSVGKKAGRGRKEKRKRRAHSSVGEVSPLNWQ